MYDSCFMAVTSLKKIFLSQVVLIGQIFARRQPTRYIYNNIISRDNKWTFGSSSVISYNSRRRIHYEYYIFSRGIYNIKIRDQTRYGHKFILISRLGYFHFSILSRGVKYDLWEFGNSISLA